MADESLRLLSNEITDLKERLQMAQKANGPFQVARSTSSRCPIPYVPGFQLNAKPDASLLIFKSPYRTSQSY